jgi:hypothetical protein
MTGEEPASGRQRKSSDRRRRLGRDDRHHLRGRALAREDRPHDLAPEVMAVNGNGSSWWRQQITVGNIVQIAMIAFGLAGFYFTTSATLTSHAMAIDVQAKAMTEVIADIRRLDREAALERDKMLSRTS